MILLVLFTLLFAYLFHQLYWRRRNLPPGPMPFPLVGNIPMLDSGTLDKQFLSLKKKYGDVMTVWLPHPFIIISDADKMKTIFIRNGEKISERPQFQIADFFFQGSYGLIFNNNLHWRDQRRFALHVLRDFGIGRPILEQTIIDQATAVCDYFKNFNEKPMELTKVLTTAIGNIIYQLAFGKTVDFESNLIYDFRNKLIENTAFFEHPLGFLCELWLPLRYLDIFFGGIYKKTLKEHYQLVDFLNNHIKEHRETINFEGEPRDYIDAFLMEQKKQQKAGEEIKDEWSDKQLVAAIYDLFSAGMETTSTSTRTFILHLIRNPEVQKKCHEEIDAIIGKDRIITMADQPKLPYFSACLQELQRISVILTLNLQRLSSDEIEVDGYTIPKGSIFVPQFPSVHLDEDVFPDPHTFDPSRHLDKNGNFVKDDRITPFSVGKRACLGESLARMELFLFSATFLQHYEFLPEIEGQIPPLEYEPGLIKSPTAFKVRAKERK